MKIGETVAAREHRVGCSSVYPYVRVTRSPSRLLLTSIEKGRDPDYVSPNEQFAITPNYDLDAN